MENRENRSYFNLKNYSLPKTKREVVPTIYKSLSRKTDLDFDIYDFDAILNDEKTKEIIREGQTIGCFYIESPGMRSLLKKLSCNSFNELVAASSIIRPGVAESGMMQEYIARHKDPARRKYLLPEMGELLSETYGVMVYQEDVIRICHYIAGLSLEESDLLRRAMSGKMRSKAAMQRIADKFLSSCMSKGITLEQTRELWRQISSFAGYAFCKAHSASFAQLSFQVAFLKAHYPAEFMANVLSNGGGFYSPQVYLQEARRMGITVLLPSVNYSYYEYTGKGKELRMGFMSIKNLSITTINNIIDKREKNGKYKDLSDFVLRTIVGDAELTILIQSGALDCFPQSRVGMMRQYDQFITKRKYMLKHGTDFFNFDGFHLDPGVKDFFNAPEFEINKICLFEYEHFGFFVSKHPLEFFKQTDHPSIVKARDMHLFERKKIKMIGWFMTSKRIKTKNGKIMKFLSLEDLTGTFEAVIFPNVYEEVARKTMSMGPYIVEGKVDMETGNNIIVDRLEVLTAKSVKLKDVKDSAEDKYLGDIEKFYEEEIELLEEEYYQRKYAQI